MLNLEFKSMLRLLDNVRITIYVTVTSVMFELILTCMYTCVVYLE